MMVQMRQARVFDSFNRADGILTYLDTGQRWRHYDEQAMIDYPEAGYEAYAIRVEGNAAVSTGTNYATVDTGSPVGEFVIKFLTVPDYAGTYIWILAQSHFRESGSSFLWMTRQQVFAPGNSWYFSPTVQAGDEVRATFDENGWVELFINGAPATYADTPYNHPGYGMGDPLRFNPLGLDTDGYHAYAGDVLGTFRGLASSPTTRVDYVDGYALLPVIVLGDAENKVIFE